MEELVRAVEATVFASAEPLGVDDIALHVGEGDVAATVRSGEPATPGAGSQVMRPRQG